MLPACHEHIHGTIHLNLKFHCMVISTLTTCSPFSVVLVTRFNFSISFSVFFLQIIFFQFQLYSYSIILHVYLSFSFSVIYTRMCLLIVFFLIFYFRIISFIVDMYMQCKLEQQDRSYIRRIRQKIKQKKSHNQVPSTDAAFPR